MRRETEDLSRAPMQKDVLGVSGVPPVVASGRGNNPVRRQLASSPQESASYVLNAGEDPLEWRSWSQRVLSFDQD